MENIDTKEMAKLVRKELKTHFPRHKFYVRIERYSMGSSINVTWIDGPIVKDVETISGHFHGSKPYSNDFIFFNRNYSEKRFVIMVKQMKDNGVPPYNRAVEARKTLYNMDFYNVQPKFDSCHSFLKRKYPLLLKISRFCQENPFDS